MTTNKFLKIKADLRQRERACKAASAKIAAKIQSLGGHIEGELGELSREWAYYEGRAFAYNKSRMVLVQNS